MLADVPADVGVKHGGYREERPPVLDWSGPDAPQELAREILGHPVPEIVVPMYALPEPTVTIILPDGYRGPLAVELLPSLEDVPHEPGKRRFELALTEDRLVSIAATPLLYRGETLWDLKARFANGEELPGMECLEGEPGTCALRSVVSPGFTDPRSLRALFLVGHGADCRALHDELHERSPDGGIQEKTEAVERYFSPPIR